MLVALTNRSHVHHGRAHEWLSGIKSFATTPITESGLMRMLLNPVVAGQIVTGPQALSILSGIRADARCSYQQDDSSLVEPVIDVIGLSGHKQVTDLHLVNLAAKHGLVLVTFDARLATALTASNRGHVQVL